jgi:hypothetical protein
MCMTEISLRPCGGWIPRGCGRTEGTISRVWLHLHSGWAQKFSGQSLVMLQVDGEKVLRPRQLFQFLQQGFL